MKSRLGYFISFIDNNKKCQPLTWMCQSSKWSTSSVSCCWWSFALADPANMPYTIKYDLGCITNLNNRLISFADSCSRLDVLAIAKYTYILRGKDSWSICRPLGTPINHLKWMMSPSHVLSTVFLMLWEKIRLSLTFEMPWQIANYLIQLTNAYDAKPLLRLTGRGNSKEYQLI